MCFRPPEATMKAHNICGECGEENPPGETTCMKCGAKIGFTPPSASQIGAAGASVPIADKASTPHPPSTPKAPGTPKAPAVPHPPVG